MNGLVALIAVCIAAANCTTIFEPNVRLQSQCAKDKTKNCVVPNLEQYEDDFATYEAVAEFASNRTNVDDLADSFVATHICLENENKKDECSGDNQDYIVDMNVDFAGDFLRTDFHRELMVNASQSYCLQYANLRDLVYDDFQNYCVGGLYQDLYNPEQDPCRAVEKMRRCMLDLVFHYCDYPAAAFVDFAWRYGVTTAYGRQWLLDSTLPGSLINGCYQ